MPRLHLAALFRSGSRGVRYGGWRGDAQTPGGLDRLTLPRPSRPDFGDEQKLKSGSPNAGVSVVWTGSLGPLWGRSMTAEVLRFKTRMVVDCRFGQGMGPRARNRCLADQKGC